MKYASAQQSSDLIKHESTGKAEALYHSDGFSRDTTPQDYHLAKVMLRNLAELVNGRDVFVKSSGKWRLRPGVAAKQR